MVLEREAGYGFPHSSKANGGPGVEPPLLFSEGLLCAFGWLIADCYHFRKNQPVPLSPSE